MIITIGTRVVAQLHVILLGMILRTLLICPQILLLAYMEWHIEEGISAYFVSIYFTSTREDFSLYPYLWHADLLIVVFAEERSCDKVLCRYTSMFIYFYFGIS